MVTSMRPKNENVPCEVCGEDNRVHICDCGHMACKHCIYTYYTKEHILKTNCVNCYADPEDHTAFWKIKERLAKIAKWTRHS